MDVNLTPDTEKQLRNFAAESGRGTDELVEDAVAGYFDELHEVRQHIEEGFRQAQRGELTDGEQARLDIRAMKDGWRATRLGQR